MADDEAWCWHAYHYAFRRVMLGIFAKTSPLDPSGDWHAPEMIGQAERYFRAKFGRRVAPPIAPASSPEAARTNWRSIPADLLTDAERRLAAPEIARMGDLARQHIAAVVTLAERLYGARLP